MIRALEKGTPLTEESSSSVAVTADEIFAMSFGENFEPTSPSHFRPSTEVEFKDEPQLIRI